MDRSGQLREGVRRAFSAAPGRPEAHHPFSLGRLFAEGLEYPPALLGELPSASVDAFAGVSNVSLFTEMPPVASLQEFRAAGFGEVKLLQAIRNARTMNPRVLAAEVFARR